ncbi:hypothetical protein CLCHR_01070 [Clostridium chromiireducens]|uniref:Uncharacterized protein n=1 Tax=Clostridium chromiireducens TaxID=225345 RepID=A0A1V4J2I8_9CLOT|nr:hypothetical protein CLCHR_01070 [Clostridium chromiireducens]
MIYTMQGVSEFQNYEIRLHLFLLIIKKCTMINLKRILKGCVAYVFFITKLKDKCKDYQYNIE